jgi:DMSO/TMAO reductase YedYZ molybdopterin-dependent catalytic subunit
VQGAVQSPSTWPLTALAELPQQEVAVTLECAGNGRAYLRPEVEGEQWGLGAVSTAVWKGARLTDLLEKAGVRPEAIEVVFDGADGFQRSLPIADALNPQVTLVLEMNGVPLPVDHGGPLRLVVPTWYGVAAVKWLQRVEPSAEAFCGHFQVERYIIEGQPVREMEPRALILSPEEGEYLPLQPQHARGVVWTGRGQINSVQLSDDGGSTWSDAELGPSVSPFAWRQWQVSWTPKARGEVSLLARATDSAGRTQPLEQRRNDLGYSNNGVVPRTVKVG